MNVIVKALGRDHVIRPGHVAVPAALRSAARLPQVASPIREFVPTGKRLARFSRVRTQASVIGQTAPRGACL